MTTLFRYCKLEVGAPERVFWNEAKYPSPSLAAGTVHAIEGVEATADRETLLAMLARQELMPSDLVFMNGRWFSFAEAPDFYEACEGLTDLRVLGLKLSAIFWGSSAVAVAVGWYVLTLWLRGP